MAAPDEFRIAPATEQDLPVILRLIKGLATYERLSHEVVATEASLHESLFGPKPVAEVVIGYVGAEPVGFAVWFHNYSTFLGRPGLYLEDLFVLPPWRGRGFGRQLLTHLAQIAVGGGCGRMEWTVLDWNEPAQRFYLSLGAQAMEAWKIYRVTGEALRALATGSSSTRVRRRPSFPETNTTG